MNDGVILLAVTVGLIVILFGGAMACSELTCEDLGDNSDVKTKYSWVSGCYVRVDGRWIPRDSWRGEYEQRKSEQ